MTHAPDRHLAAVFTEWHRRWTETPEEYATWQQAFEQPDDDYGTAAARCFEAIEAEIPELS
jgi:hypothetical protein